MHRCTKCLDVIIGSGLFHLVYGLDIYIKNKNKKKSDKSTEIVGAQHGFNAVRVCI